MLGKMQRAEYSNGRNEEIRGWVEEHPEIKAKIEERLRNVPAANRERAFINTRFISSFTSPDVGSTLLVLALHASVAMAAVPLMIF